LLASLPGRERLLVRIEELDHSEKVQMRAVALVLIFSERSLSDQPKPAIQGILSAENGQPAQLRTTRQERA
jgi:hypothetical protein